MWIGSSFYSSPIGDGLEVGEPGGKRPQSRRCASSPKFICCWNRVRAGFGVFQWDAGLCFAFPRYSVARLGARWGDCSIGVAWGMGQHAGCWITAFSVNGMVSLRRAGSPSGCKYRWFEVSILEHTYPSTSPLIFIQVYKSANLLLAQPSAPQPPIHPPRRAFDHSRRPFRGIVPFSVYCTTNPAGLFGAVPRIPTK